MHDVLAKVVGLEAEKLLKLAQAPDALSADQLSALEILARCAKALKTDANPPTGLPPSTAEALALVENG